jgi:hypothetical protein
MSELFTTFTLQPPEEPLGEPEKTKAEEEEAEKLEVTLNGSATKAPSTAASVSGTSTPAVNWNPDHRPIANWIIPIVSWASSNGWSGYVTSGYRTAPEQEQAAAKYAAQLNKSISEVYPDGPLASNHCKTAYPGGAVDVTEAAQLASVLKRYPYKPNLVWGEQVIEDGVHFSATGH